MKDLNNPIILGDFNFTEGELDRYPFRRDTLQVTDEWDKMMRKFKLLDGWRLNYQNETQFTFTQEATGSMSRIDRIYVTENSYIFMYSWSIQTSAELSDHDIISVNMLDRKLPFIGKGMWRMNDEMVKNEVFRKKAKTVLLAAQERMNESKEKEENIQEIWEETKEKLKRMARRVTKTKKRLLNKEEKKNMKKLNNCLEDFKSENEEIQKNAGKQYQVIKSKIAQKRRVEMEKLNERARMNYAFKGERNTKYWFNLNKERHSKEVIIGLENEQGVMETNTRDMAEIATRYHENLQKQPEMNEDREQAISQMENILTRELKPNQKQMLAERITEKQIKEALKATSNGTTPGIDGIPYEFYKSWRVPENDDERKDNPDITKILWMVFNDIEEQGLQVPTFSDGIMYLLYKKKSKIKIENYRPVTLLNADYKIYTKTIATKLGKVVKTILHENQAGFVPKRSLYDHTRTSQLVVEYCELKNIDGCIASLDQEKAYDKIDHEYMWRIMKKNGFPDVFIARIQEMYSDTGKSVMVNGVLPRQYKVKRGVHQGDPMSCLLYDIAIEPLAESIRRSNLKGLNIPGARERLIVTLFADDTLVYLSGDDDMKDLQKIIKTFCKASTAVFNLEKTEYLPIGTTEHRMRVAEERKVNGYEIERGTTVIKDGVPMRTLGAWIGNKCNVNAQWDKILERQKKILNVWQGCHLSYRGKELILKALVMSRAMFLTTVNGMPEEVKQRMQSIMKDFMWDGKKRGKMAWEQIINKREDGGLNIPDIGARVDAITIIWIKKWLQPRKKRPLWTNIADEILKHKASQNPQIEEKAKDLWILQSWHEKYSKGNANAKSGLIEWLKAARTYNLRIDARKISKHMKQRMPAWHHIHVANKYHNNKGVAKTLRDKYNIRTIGDVEKVASTVGRKPYRQVEKRMAKAVLETLPEKWNPLIVTPTKVRERNLDHTPERKIKAKKINIEKEPRVFNPDITKRGDPLKLARIFCKKQSAKTRGINVQDNGQQAYRIVIEGQKTNIEHVIRARNDIGEIQKIVVILRNNQKDNMVFKMGSEENLKKIFNKIEEWEDIGWYKVENATLWKELVYLLRIRDATTAFQKIKQKRLLRKTPEFVEREVSSQWEVDGVCLSKLDQDLAYQLAVQRTKKEPGSKQTRRNIERIQTKLKEILGRKPEEKRIWKGLKSPINNKIGDFIWKTIHGRNACGRYFLSIPDWEDKQYCQCMKVESIRHILFGCKKNSQNELWNEAKILMERLTEQTWITPGFEILCGLGLMVIKDKKKKEDKTASVIYKIIVSKTAWILWKERNGRIMNNEVIDLERTKKVWQNSIKDDIINDFNKIEKTGLAKRRTETKKFEQKWCRNKESIKLVDYKKGLQKLQIKDNQLGEY